jgi:amino-acid N-acetyltransferase
LDRLAKEHEEFKKVERPTPEQIEAQREKIERLLHQVETLGKSISGLYDPVLPFRAARGGVVSCQLVSWEADGALLRELYTAAGSGTQVQEDAGAFIRPAEAADVAHIVEVIRPLEEAGALVRRNRDRLEEEIDYFLVADIDRNVVGCCAVYPFGETAELACVAVHASYRENARSSAAAGERSARIGSSLLAAAEERARQGGAKNLFALTTQTRDWFLDHGFTEAEPTALPAPKQAMYNYQRNARVMIKALT